MRSAVQVLQHQFVTVLSPPVYPSIGRLSSSFHEHSVPFPLSFLVTRLSGHGCGSRLWRHLHQAQSELERGLEASAEVLIEIAIDDGVDAAVEEGQPVGEGVDVDRECVELGGGQVPIISQQNEDPEGQPGDGEQQRHHQEHVDHADLSAVYAPALVLCLGITDGCGRFEELQSDTGVHDRNQCDGGQVDVREEHHGVDLPHALIWPRLPAAVQRVGGIVLVHHEVEGIVGDGQRDRRRTHDGNG